MKKIPWAIWAAVVLGWIASVDDSSHNGSITWLLGVLILVIAYYGENWQSTKIK